MVCHRWTLALIIFSVPLLVTVISAFRVRLPGTSHEVKSELRRHKCKDCDVNDLNLDPITDSFKKESAKHSYDDIKKILRDKRHLIEEKLSKASFEQHNISGDESEDDDVDDVSDLDESTFKSAVVKVDSDIKARSKKPSVVVDFDDDDDSDIEDDDEFDDYKQKESKKSSSMETKKKVEPIPHLFKDVKSIPKPKTILKEKMEKKIDDKVDIGKIKVEHTIPPIHLKKKIDVLSPKESLKESLTLNEESLKPVKREIKIDIHKDETKKIIKPKVSEKPTDYFSKESPVVKPITEKVILGVKDGLTDKDKTKPKKIDFKVSTKKIKEDDIEIKSKLFEKKVEKTVKYDTETKEKSKVVADFEKLERSEEITVDKKESVIKSDSKETRVQHLSEALVRRNLLQSEFEDFYAFLPTFAPNFSRIHNPECRRHGQILLRQLRGTKLWALNMLDATAKIPSGLLQGNGIQLGDFDQCLGIRARVQLDTGSVVKIQGKYCLAMVDVKAEHPDLETPVHLARGRNLFKSRIDDPGHFVPRFSTLSWGVCVPAPCGPDDVEVVLRDAIKHYQYKTGISVRVKVDETDCHVRKGPNWWKEWLEVPTILTLSLYAIVIILVLLATLQDFLARTSPEDTGEKDEDDKGGEKDEKDEEATKDKDSTGGFLCSFSLYNSLSKLVAPASRDEIACIHGLRALATIALLVAHKFLPLALTPYTNRLRLSEIVTSPLLSWCRAGWMFTDCFLLLSGTLTSYRKSTNDTMASKLLSRYIRLTPALLAVVLFYAYVWDDISSGPMWGALVTKNAEVCRQGWWWNLLYVQNYYGFEDMCAPQTHHMALDFQLTIIGGVLVWAIQSEVPFSTTLMPILHLSSAYSRYTTFRDHRLTPLAYHGVSVSQLYRTGRLSYTSVFHRCTPYFIGISLGLALRNPTNFTKLMNILGWFICGTLMGLVLWAGGDSGYLDYRYDVTFASLYATLAPIAMALAISWLVYGVHNEHSELLSSLLGCRTLIFISRISYALYLVQFIVYLTNTAIIRAPKEFSILTAIDLQELLTILICSIVLTITLVIPLQSLPKVSFGTTVHEEVNDKEPPESEPIQNNKDNKANIEQDEHVKEPPQRRSFLAHREVLEEIPEVEVEYEIQRDSHDGLEEILEEEDEEGLEEEMEERLDEEDLEIIEEEQGESGEDFWAERRNYLTRRYFQNDQDVDEWEWTANGNERTASEHRYNR